MANVESGARRGGGGPSPAIPRTSREAIVALVRAGAPPTTAAVKCGIPRRTHEDWLARGRRPDGPEPCRRYVEDIERAVEEWKYGRIQAVEAQEDQDWRAAMTLLERRFPKEFGQRKQIEGQISIQATPMIDPSKGTLERLQLLRELLAEFAPDTEDPALSESARPALELIEGEGFTEIDP